MSVRDEAPRPVDQCMAEIEANLMPWLRHVAERELRNMERAALRMKREGNP